MPQAVSSVAVSTTANAHQNKVRAVSSVAVSTTVRAHSNRAGAVSTVTVTTVFLGGHTLFAGRAGTGQFLIRGSMPAQPSAPGDAIIDADGTVLTDENGNVLIWA